MIETRSNNPRLLVKENVTVTAAGAVSGGEPVSGGE